MSDEQDDITPRSKRYWSRIYLPHELADLLFMVAKRQGVKRDEIHRFIYHLLIRLHPGDVDAVQKHMGVSPDSFEDIDQK